ncbi:MAG: hypothetical protein AB8I08_11625 [Sandaracinaceae bacterium]
MPSLRGWLSILTLALLGAAFASPAAAQSGGLASGLGDPSGRPQAPRLEEVPAGPSTYGSDVVVPPPPGGSAETGASIPASPSSAATLTRMRALDASLTSLAASGGVDYLRGVLSLLAGGAGIAFGAISYELGSPFDRMAPYFIVLGGTTILRTVLVDFILPPDTRTPAIEYQTMPQGTDAERRARIEFGERALEGIAEAAMISRIVDGSVNIGGALAIIPAYLAPNDFEIDSPIEALIFIGPAIAMVGGIITLASPSAAEQRWDAYREMRERLGASAALDAVRETAMAPTIDFDVSAGPEGGLASMRGRF